MRIDAQSVRAMNPSFTLRFVEVPNVLGGPPDGAVVALPLVVVTAAARVEHRAGTEAAPAAARPERKVRLSMS